jgi:hypothetical protein
MEYKSFNGCLKYIVIILPPIYNKIITFTKCDMRDGLYDKALSCREYVALMVDECCVLNIGGMILVLENRITRNVSLCHFVDHKSHQN